MKTKFSLFGPAMKSSPRAQSSNFSLAHSPNLQLRPAHSPLRHFPNSQPLSPCRHFPNFATNPRQLTGRGRGVGAGRAVADGRREAAEDTRRRGGRRTVATLADEGRRRRGPWPCGRVASGKQAGGGGDRRAASVRGARRSNGGPAPARRREAARRRTSVAAGRWRAASRRGLFSPHY